MITALSPSAVILFNAHAVTHPLFIKQPYAIFDYLYDIYDNYTEQQVQAIRHKLLILSTLSTLSIP